MTYSKMAETLETDGVGPWIKERRKALGLSLREFAETAGIAHSSLDKAERGGGMRRSTLELVIAALAGPDATLEEVESLRKEALAASVGLEVQHVPDEEYLQSQVLGYTGDNPILKAAATTARAVMEGITAQDVAEAMEEAEEVPDGERFSTSKITRRR